MTAACALFSEAEVERSRRYARPLYVVRIAETLLAGALLAAFAWTAVGDALDRALDVVPWWLEEPLFTAVTLLTVTVVTLPLSLWAGWLRERRFGLSTQTLGGWIGDHAKGLLIAAVLAGAALDLFEEVVRVSPGWWPLFDGAGAVGLIVALGFLAPVVLEPVFNRFGPLADETLSARLRALADRAGVPVRDVLVADASRRTRKLNAYVSGLGRTRRVVVFDTLLEHLREPEVAAVVAHELGHRRARHVEKLTLLGAAAAAGAVAFLWVLLGPQAGEPRRVPELLFLFGLMEVLASPIGAWLSRRYERAADRTALELTRDPAAVEAVLRSLATVNLADLAPPRALHVLFASHPTIPERIAAARASATVRA